MKSDLDEEVQRLLKQIVDQFDKEDQAARDRQLRTWRRLKLAWEGFTKVYYSEVAHDWRLPPDSEQIDQDHYDKPINVFRAYLESIIAALSITIPAIKCFPDDADNPLDLSTAKAGDKIAALIYRHNDAPLLWLRALFIFCTEGLTACYSYVKEDEKFGTYDQNEYEDSIKEVNSCESCQTEIPNEEIQTDQTGVEFCPNCGGLLEKNESIVTKLIGTTKLPKSRIITEVYGGLYVKVPNYAMKQADCPYLIFSYETHYSNALDRYPQLRDNLKVGSRSNKSTEEQWARLSPQYQGEEPINNVTVRNCWLRPSSFNTLSEDEAVQLKKLFPDGVKVVIINDNFAEASNENLDDCWTLTVNPLSDYLHHDPLGLTLVPIQDITNDLTSLIIQTIEHGIPQTFADPSVLNFTTYGQTAVIPGGIYPVTPRSGKSVGDAFYEVKTATLSKDILPFFEKIQEMGQIISGALPSLFGGQVSGSRTASEYSMSRAQALQRLQNNWKIFTYWWKNVYGKLIPMYIKEMQADEHSVEKDDQGRFINVFIRKAELEGKIGRVELEANENLPLTWSQQKDIYMQLLENTNPKIQEVLASSENVQMLANAIGITDFTVPGEDDRIKQYEEINQLINSEPIVIPPDPMQVEMSMVMGMPPPMETEQPSVEIDPVVDNHNIEADICRKYLVSEAGRLLKIENPAGYKNVLLHLKAHMEIIQQMMTPPPTDSTSEEGTGEGSGSGQMSKPTGSSSPLKRNDNVSSVQ